MTSATRSVADAVRIVRFSTDNFHKRQRSVLWREALRQQIVGLDVERLTDLPRLNSVGIALLGLGLVTSGATPSVIQRTPQLLGDGNDNLRLVI